MNDERGSATMELALLAPVLLVLLGFVVFLGRVTQARAEVDAAARDAARAASLTRTVADADVAAQRSAGDTLRGQGITCRRFSVGLDTSRFTPGGTVTAEVHCAVSLAGLHLLGLSGTKTLVSRFAAPLDRYRAITGGSSSADRPGGSNAEIGGP